VTENIYMQLLPRTVKTHTQIDKYTGRIHASVVNVMDFQTGNPGLIPTNNSTNKTNVNYHGAVIMTTAIAKVHMIHLMNADYGNSVCLSIHLSHAGIVSMRLTLQFALSDSKMCLVS